MAESITSVNNEAVKEAAKLQQRKYRDESGKFLLEGFKAIKEAHDAGIVIEKAFVSEQKADKYSFLGDFIIATEPVLKKIATTESAPESVAVAVQKIYSVDNLDGAKKVALFENIRDLGNLGTILRTAAAFSLDAVVLYGDSVDLYNPKVVRSSVGNLWKIPVIQVEDLSVFNDYQRVATLPKAENTVFLKDFIPQKPILIMFGAEADGLSQDLIEFATDRVTIEMSKEVESLNLSMSAAVILYHLQDFLPFQDRSLQCK